MCVPVCHISVSDSGQQVWRLLSLSLWTERRMLAICFVIQMPNVSPAKQLRPVTVLYRAAFSLSSSSSRVCHCPLRPPSPFLLSSLPCFSVWCCPFFSLSVLNHFCLSLTLCSTTLTLLFSLFLFLGLQILCVCVLQPKELIC